jgi:hypothetical protein
MDVVNMIILKMGRKEMKIYRIYFLKDSSHGLCEHGDEIPVCVKFGNVCTRWSTVSSSIKLLLYELIVEPLS